MLLNGVTFAVSIREIIRYFYASFHVGILRADTRNKPRFPAKSTAKRNRGKVATIASSTHSDAGFLDEQGTEFFPGHVWRELEKNHNRAKFLTAVDSVGREGGTGKR